MAPRSSYGSKARTVEQKRTFAVMLVTQRRSIDGYTADDLARTSGISLPEATAMLERERMIRAARPA